MCIGITLATFKSTEFLNELERKIKDEADFICRLVLVAKDSGSLKEREVLEGHRPGRLCGDVDGRIRIFNEIKARLGDKKQNLSICTINTVPGMFMARFDEEIVFSPYLHLDGRQSFAFVVRRGAKGANLFRQLYDYMNDIESKATKDVAGQ